MWSQGKIRELWKENRVLQKKLTDKPRRSSNDITQIVTKLMFEGKVGPALKFLEENAENAVLQPTPQVVEKLKKLHPTPSSISPCTLLQ